MSGRAWTTAEDTVLKEPITARAAAERIDRSVAAVRHRRQSFKSSGRGDELPLDRGEWPLPEMGFAERMACVQLRKWARGVEPANNLTWRIRA